MNCLRIFLLFIFISELIFPQSENKTGTTTAQFLKNGVGAEQIGMGSAVTAVVNDISSLYWNPAGLTKISNRSAIFSHSNLFADIKNDFFAFAIPISETDAIGLSITSQDYGKMEITTEEVPEGTGEFFSANDLSVGVTYSTQMVDFFSFGVTAKYISQNIYNESASAIAFDFGTQLNTNFNGILIGMNYSNFGSSMKLQGRDLRKRYDPSPNDVSNNGVVSFLGTEDWELPVNFKIGIGWNLIGKNNSLFLNENHNLILALDLQHPNDMNEIILFGANYTWNDFISFRGGYKFFDPNRSFSFGSGITWTKNNYLNLKTDFSIELLSEFEPLNLFTIRLEF